MANPNRSSLGRPRHRRPVSERSTPRKASFTWALGTWAVGGPRRSAVEAGFATPVMMRLDQAYRARLRAHDHGVGITAVAFAPHPAQHGPVGDAGGREHDVTLCQIEEPVFAIQILDAHAPGTRLLFVAAEQEASLHLAADASQGRGRQHAFRRSAAADVDV